ncbi:hypothetical protein BS78_04G020900 [Paspalum vaginatum]|nr:hypothetical protein BS78_04G020900 [Paspalum vaginatum]
MGRRRSFHLPPNTSAMHAEPNIVGRTSCRQRAIPLFVAWVRYAVGAIAGACGLKTAGRVAARPRRRGQRGARTCRRNLEAPVVRRRPPVFSSSSYEAKMTSVFLQFDVENASVLDKTRQ